MIRLIIVLVGLFILWVLFASGFDKRRKIIITVVAVLLCALGAWFDGYGKNPKENVVSVSDVVSCGVSAQYSYRTNYDFKLCLKNNATSGAIKRARFAVIASSCPPASECQEVERVVRDVAVDVPAGEQQTIVENLSFDAVPNDAENISWSMEVESVKAVR